MPAKASLRDLGEHRLRDLTRPEQVYQLTAPGLQPDFPALLSLDALPNNLPLQVTSFVGREHEIAEITELIGKNRIVTLVGSGGVGKTRVSLQVAANLLDGSGDGVWFIELAPLSDGAYIPWTIAQALGLTLPSDTDPIGHLVRALKFKRLLLVLDNCEHLVDSAARVIAAIHRGCPNVHVVASSRQSLGIAGEETFRLPSLETPPDGRALHAVDALRSASIALFVERARAGDKRFELTDNNAAIVADICRRLDGIPLAIELAASRVKLLSPRQLRDRLDERFRVLTGGSRDVLPRQQTLRALIDWSYDLLDVRERALFRRLGVFVNGFSLEGAVAVGGGDGLDELGVFDVLASLVDKSLVLVEPDEDRVRYRLLESTRAYAAEKNEAAGERELLAERDLRYFRDRVLELQDRRNRAGYDAEFDRFVAAELEDIRAALDAGLGGAGMADGAAMLAALGYFWVPAGFDSEGVARGERFLAAVPAHDHVLNARLATTVSINLFMTGKNARALELARHAVEEARASGDRLLLAPALGVLALNLAIGGWVDDAEPALAEAEAIAGVPAFLSASLRSIRSAVHAARGEYDEAAQLYQRSRREARARGDLDAELAAIVRQAETEHARGRTMEAITLVREALPMLRRRRGRNSPRLALQNLAGYLAAVDDLAGASAAAREVLLGLGDSEPEHVFTAISIEHTHSYMRSPATQSGPLRSKATLRRLSSEAAFGASAPSK